jgi:hypothetical protein
MKGVEGGCRPPIGRGKAGKRKKENMLKTYWCKALQACQRDRGRIQFTQNGKNQRIQRYLATRQHNKFSSGAPFTRSPPPTVGIMGLAEIHQ